MKLQWRHRRANVIGPNLDHWIRDHVQHRLPQSAAAAAASLSSYTLFSLRRLRLCAWLSERLTWLTEWASECGQQQAKEERAAASRQPISGSGLANVQLRGSSTTVSATARATSTQTGILRRQRKGTFRRIPLSLLRGSIQCRPVSSFLSPPDTPRGVSESIPHPDRRQHPGVVVGLCDEVAPRSVWTFWR